MEALGDNADMRGLSDSKRHHPCGSGTVKSEGIFARGGRGCSRRATDITAAFSLVIVVIRYYCPTHCITQRNHASGDSTLVL